MKNRWSEHDALTYVKRYRLWGEPLALRTYSARLIGQDPDLVLHGGGNTSVKIIRYSLTGEPVRVICIKGSGWDLDTIEPPGHPAVRLEALESLRALPRLSDENMVNALRANMLDASGPTPSVETLLHAFLPHPFIDHSHADAVLAITNRPDGEKKALALAGDRLAIVPYIMPGFALAKLAAEIYERRPAVEGLILLKHGLFTFGETARQSYERMIRWVSRAEQVLSRAKRYVFQPLRVPMKTDDRSVGMAANILRAECWPTRMVVRHRATPLILAFATSRQAARSSQEGPATPDHIIRTKARPLMMPPIPISNEKTFRAAYRSRLGAYQRDYERYFKTQTQKKRVTRRALDPLPRVVIVPGMGMFALAIDAKAADIALDIYEHTVKIIVNASREGRYQALPESDLFDMEYWSLEQAKLGKAAEGVFSRQVVWISGAASGIGLATAKAFGEGGAHVYLTDLDPRALALAVQYLGFGTRVFGRHCDVTRPSEVNAAFDHCSNLYGGVDIVISNAGIAPMQNMASCPEALLRRSFEVNFFAHQHVAQAAVRVFERQGFGGSLLFNASKSAFNPGPGFGPYSVPKAGVVALMRQYAVELGKIRVRVNAVNADRVRTHLFANGLLAKRAKARGLSLSDYLKGNLLGEEVLPEDVAEAFIALAMARKTTGAVLPVDGGNAAAFPR